jgi:hypothetical protein
MTESRRISKKKEGLPMLKRMPPLTAALCLAGALLLGLAEFAGADVTIEQKTTVDLGITKMSTSATEQYTADKKHQSSLAKCSGLMSLVCGKTDTAEIVRLDKSVTYQLQPDKKTYREEPFPTEAERREMQERMQAAMEKAKSCAAQQPAQKPAVDTSKCQMSPPVFTSKDLGAAGQILGHAVHRSEITMTQSCADKSTGDVCDMQFAFDVWLTNDDVAGLQDRTAFDKAYLEKIGVTGASRAQMQAAVARMMGPYMDQLRQLSSKADLRGSALRNSFHMAFGGPHCGAAQKSSSGADSGDSGPPTSLGDVGGKLLTGLFAKKNKAEDDNLAANAPATPPGMIAAVTLVTETTAVRTDPIPASQFEVPQGYSLVVPPAAKAGDMECGPSQK